jgi:ketosteroid isomerase-like protein
LRKERTTTPDELLRAYEAALATQDWANVEPLLHPDACVTFSNGTSFRGRDAVGEAFARNFALIEDETYAISAVHWIAQADCHAACVYEYRWSGRIDGRETSGAGRGTSLLTNEDGRWLVLAEHLGALA